MTLYEEICLVFKGPSSALHPWKWQWFSVAWCGWCLLLHRRMETWKKLHQRSCGWRRSRDWPVKLGRSKGESGRMHGLARFTLAICCIQVCLLALWIEWVFRVSSKGCFLSEVTWPVNSINCPTTFYWLFYHCLFISHLSLQMASLKH